MTILDFNIAKRLRDIRLALARINEMMRKIKEQAKD